MGSLQVAWRRVQTQPATCGSAQLVTGPCQTGLGLGPCVHVGFESSKVGPSKFSPGPLAAYTGRGRALCSCSS